MNLKGKLSLGLASFEDIIKKDKIYVDKTEMIEKILELDNKYYFLSRPRRFGKSLFVSTLKNLFEGKKELFKDTLIYNNWDWNKSYPIIHLDLMTFPRDNEKLLKLTLLDYLSKVGEKYNIKLNNDLSLGYNFSTLINKIYENTGKKVVVLIDEYDKPILDNVDNVTLAESIRDELKDFYGALKSVETSLKFVFITGVSRFSKTSIFSDLNNLVDLTVREDFSTICGYTQNELESYFNDFIVKISERYDINQNSMISLIKEWYNGYSWDGENFLYAPFSVLNLFSTNVFDNYWFETGTPSFIIKIMEKQNNVDVLFDENLKLFGAFPNFDVKNLDLKTVLLQSGYLTIKRRNLVPGELTEYNLDIPNKEVRESLFSYIIGVYVNKTGEGVYPIAKNMFKQLISVDGDGFQTSIEMLFSGINYSLHSKLNDMEAFYHILFLSWMRLIGFDVQGEVIQLKGRADLVLVKDDYVIVMELKYSETKSLDLMLDEALNQIRENEYYKPYQDKKIIFVGIAFKDKDIGSKLEYFNK
ncbi:MAG: ATP-binding protein [Methanobrevibacter sp.]|jgi:hypothetical protein|nr:ATP-binding protein [Candidatus Methanovirga procula]